MDETHREDTALTALPGQPRSARGGRSQGIGQGAPFIAADVGGTYARLAWAHIAADRCVQLAHDQRYTCVDWPNLEAIVADFTARVVAIEAAIPAAAVIACAGYVQGDTLVSRNLPWPVSLSVLRTRLAIDRIEVINDFEALAHAVPALALSETRLLIGPAGTGHFAATAPVAVMGPGTGLGCAVVLPGDRDGRNNHGAHRILPTEAAHIALAASTPVELAVLQHLLRDRSHVAVEHVLSGPGLLTLYRVLCALHGVGATLATPAQVTSAAADDSAPLAAEAVQVFCGWLGSFAGDVASLYGAAGGVLLAGGFLPQMAGLLLASPFEARFLDKGVMRPWLRQVPVFLVEHGRLGVAGAARWMATTSA